VASNHVTSFAQSALSASNTNKTECRKEPVEEVEPVLVQVVFGKPAVIACCGGGATGDPVFLLTSDTSTELV
jgi:hypothetical protein